jgi:1,4-dihydroxy-2-naphthoate octaprenyltransferase
MEQAVSRRRAWWMAVRPFSAPASIVPVLVGGAAAAGESFNVPLFLLCFAGSVLIHAGTNLATDFFDFTHGVQPPASLGAAIRTGVISAKAVHRAAIACFALGAVCGLVIVAYTGWPVLAAGVASVLAGYFYTAKPFSYGRRGLGEVMVFIFMGLLMVMATYYVQLERIDWYSFWVALPVAILVANILHANNLRDIQNDRSRNKVTISTLVDRPAADYILYALVAAAFASVAIAVAAGALPTTCLAVFGAVPAALQTVAVLKEREAARLNLLVRNSARLHLHFGLLLTLGLLLALL